jgi:hypothetical protein
MIPSQGSTAADFQRVVAHIDYSRQKTGSMDIPVAEAVVRHAALFSFPYWFSWPSD